MKRFAIVIVLIMMMVITILLVIYEQVLATKQELKVQVWLADVNSITGKVRICVDIPETGTYSCKEFDGSSSRRDSVGESSDPIVIDAGIYKLGLENVLENSTLIGCVYVFKDDNGYCTKDSIPSPNETHAMMLFTKVKSVYYDKETGRLYEYGMCYLEKEGSKLCIEDEGVQFPEMKE